VNIGVVLGVLERGVEELVQGYPPPVRVCKILQFLDTGLTALPFLGNSKPRRRHEKRAREISPALVRMCAKGCSIGAGLAISAL
jgi:hypothetical protein